MHSHTDEERWDRHKTREAFGRFAEVKKQPGTPEYDKLRSELVVAHLNLVRYLAVKFANRGEALDDLIQVGTVGLLKAIDRFDLERGVEFTTYATPTIVGEIKRYFRDKGWAVKVPRRLQELNLAVNRAVEKLSVKIGRSPTVAELAQHLNATEEDILEAQELGQAYNLLSLDTELSGEGDKKSQTLADYIGTTDAGLALLEEQDVVFRPAPSAGDPAPPAAAAAKSADWRQTIVPDDVLLFRYSALTFNAHRIHYDRRYVTEVEGYPVLIVHGPLLATFLLELIRQRLPAAHIEAFRFKALRPTFDTSPFSVHGNAPDGEHRCTVWSTDNGGIPAMDGEAIVRD